MLFENSQFNLNKKTNKFFEFNYFVFMSLIMMKETFIAKMTATGGVYANNKRFKVMRGAARHLLAKKSSC